MLVAFVMLYRLKELVLLIGIMTVTTVYGKRGILFAVMESISVVNKLPGFGGA